MQENNNNPYEKPEQDFNSNQQPIYPDSIILIHKFQISKVLIKRLRNMQQKNQY